MELPNYLKLKLASFDIIQVAQLQSHGYIILFQWLKDVYPSITYKALFDLYCLQHNLPLNSLSMQFKDDLKQSYYQAPPRYAPIAPDLIYHFLTQAQLLGASDINEVPIGAIIVKDQKIIGRGYNQTIKNKHITHHAEIIALNQATDYLNSHRLSDCDIYVNYEPCLMCAGAIMHSRIKRLMFGALEPKTGAVISQYKVFDNIAVNHHTEVIGPVDQQYFSQALHQFFSNKR